MFALFTMIGMALFVGGATVEECQEMNLTPKQCVQYVKDNAQADFGNMND